MKNQIRIVCFEFIEHFLAYEGHATIEQIVDALNKDEQNKRRKVVYKEDEVEGIMTKFFESGVVSRGFIDNWVYALPGYFVDCPTDRWQDDY